MKKIKILMGVALMLMLQTFIVNNFIIFKTFNFEIDFALIFWLVVNLKYYKENNVIIDELLYYICAGLLFGLFSVQNNYIYMLVAVLPVLILGQIRIKDINKLYEFLCIVAIFFLNFFLPVLFNMGTNFFNYSLMNLTIDIVIYLILNVMIFYLLKLKMIEE